MIEDFETGVRNLIADKGAELLRHAESFVRPLIVAEHARHPRPVGSGVLVRVHNRSFFVTAAHVLDNALRHPWAIAGAPNLVAPQSVVQYTEPPGGRRLDDVADVGFVELTQAEVQGLGAVDFLSPERLDPDDRLRPPPRDLARPFYYVFGYPGSRMKANPKRNTIRYKSAFPFLSVPAGPAVYTALKLPPQSHLIIEFERTQSLGRRGELVAPDPHGVSGGGIWRVDDFTRSEPGAARLVAIATDWRKEAAVLVGTRIGVVLEGIRAQYPELDPFIPRTGDP